MIGARASRRAAFLILGGLLIAAGSVAAGDFRYEPDSEGNWPRNLVREAQARLQGRGFDPGPIDGLYGPKMAAAIRAFQTAQGMTANGRISEVLLESLGIPLTVSAGDGV